MYLKYIQGLSVDRPSTIESGHAYFEIDTGDLYLGDNSGKGKLYSPKAVDVLVFRVSQSTTNNPTVSDLTSDSLGIGLPNILSRLGAGIYTLSWSTDVFEKYGSIQGFATRTPTAARAFLNISKFDDAGITITNFAETFGAPADDIGNAVSFTILCFYNQPDA